MEGKMGLWSSPAISAERKGIFSENVLTRHASTAKRRGIAKGIAVNPILQGALRSQQTQS
jgi:hypothetical protein